MVAMRAFVVTGPGEAAVHDVPDPEPGPGDVVVAVERAGVCGTDTEFWTGHMTYLHDGQAAYPVRIGHEWCGTVIATGPGTDPSWLGCRVTGDTMLGCGHCPRCRSGRQHLCRDRYEIGIRHGFPGALAERLRVPAGSLQRLPDTVDAVAGALVEPGANALRAVRASLAGPGKRILIFGPGTIGLLAAGLARALGATVQLVGEHRTPARAALGPEHPNPGAPARDATNPPTAEHRTPGAPARDISNPLTAEHRTPAPENHRADLHSLAGNITTSDDLLDDEPWDAVIDCSSGAGVPARAVELVEPGGRLVFIGIASAPSLLDTRALVLRDVTATGVLSGSGALADTIAMYASGAVDPRPAVAATVGLSTTAAVLAGDRDPSWGPAPKIHIDPRR